MTVLERVQELGLMLSSRATNVFLIIVGVVMVPYLGFRLFQLIRWLF